MRVFFRQQIEITFRNQKSAEKHFRLVNASLVKLGFRSPPPLSVRKYERVTHTHTHRMPSLIQ